MIQVLKDILLCLQKWGFKKVFTCLSHGDLQHNLTILEAFRVAKKDFGLETYFVLSESESKRFDPEDKYSDHTLTYQETSNPEPSKYVDVHAGKYETSLMLSKYPNVVNTEIAKKLKPTETTPDDFLIWRQGGEKNKNITPLGYCGNPADIDIEYSEKIFKETCKLVAATIYKHLKKIS